VGPGEPGGGMGGPLGWHAVVLVARLGHGWRVPSL
jgi:hypothetical protein